MAWVVFIGSVLLCCEILLRLAVFAEASTTVKATGKILATVQSRHISDHWKEQAIPMYACQAAASSTRFLVKLLAVAAPVIVAVLIDQFWDFGFAGLIVDVAAIAISILVAAVYIKLRSR